MTVSFDEKPKETTIKRVVRAVGRFIDFFNEYDSLYITPNYYDLSLMAIYYNYSENYSIRSSEPHKQHIEFVPDSRNRLGVYVSWFIFSVGFSFDFKDSFNNNKTGNQFNFNLYTSKLGLEVMRVSSGNNFRLHKIHGFPLESAASFSRDFSGLNVDTKYVNLYYIFNNRKFSFPAAYNQSTVQRISAGSFITGFSYSTHKFDLDCNELPTVIRDNLNPDMRIDKIRFNDVSLNFGYSYNWVFARNFLANATLSPVIAYKTSKVHNIDAERNKWSNRLALDYAFRVAVVYNNNKYFAGASYQKHSFSFKNGDYNMNNGFGILQVYARFNFLEKKRYKKKGKH